MNFKRLISEDCVHVSLGRTSFWILFCLLLWFWIQGKEVPESLFNTWWLVLLYNFGKKVTPFLNKTGDKK